MRYAAWFVLLLVVLAAGAAGWIAPAPFDRQDREAIGVRPSPGYWLGTDELGRDRLSRLLHGTRVSLALAPGAALLSVLAAAVVGTLAGFLGGRWERTIAAAADLTLSLPWLFLLLALRALLPLNVSPWLSLAATFAILGLLGWAGPARVVLAAARKLRDSEFVLAARARGVAPGRILLAHLIPNVRPILTAQFLIAIPAYVLAEANLGMLGLGVSESMPSWGNLLRELEQQPDALMHPAERPELFVPAALLIVVVICLHAVAGRAGSAKEQTA